ncbi:ABC transporter permease subunit [Actinomadura sp. ATCC 31491]|uniref:ABC transporter permease subunit n=1 Tax=Actinomadura luzonensis TaxID=2805427 RepID=A0ABT0FIT4_9ACTN|nr:ABC transporter permease subunit [Actinomadura luzonensis]MCK2212216.1 ABC transporter permease subunit [Actinomadura luzonensis]
MIGPLIAKSLRDQRRVVFWWTAGLGAFIALYLAVYGSVRQSPETYGPAMIAKFPGPLRDLMGGLEDMTSGAGYLQTVVYQLFVPMLFIACATLLANRALAGPEETGTLELVVTLPVDRRRLVLARLAGLALALLGVAAVTLLVAWGMSAAEQNGVPFDRILAGHLGVLLLGLFFGTVALTVGAATGRRLVASAVVGVWVAAGYMVVTVGRSVAAISWLKWVSPFHYYAEGRPIYEGVPVGDYLVLAGATAVLALTAVLAFDRRDVGV